METEKSVVVDNKTKFEIEADKVASHKNTVSLNNYQGEIETHSAFMLKSDIKIYSKIINVDDIVMSNFKKVSRDKTVIGLKGVVGEWGVVNPIHVLLLDSGKYLLLDGLRRVYARVKNNEKDIPAQVWDFTDKLEGKDKANIISLMINRSERYSAKEMWEQVQILEEVNDLTPAVIEFLLQMHAGDVMKLKDVMFSELEFSEIKDKLFTGEYNIDTAYKKLCAERKKVNRLAREDEQTLEEDIYKEEHKTLNDEEVKELLNLDDNDEDLELDALDKSKELTNFRLMDDKSFFPSHIESAILERDGNKCRCCGADSTWSSALAPRHIVPIMCGGKSTEDNGLTMCANCFITMHVYSFGNFTVDIKDVKNDKDKETLKRIFKYGNIAIEAVKRAGFAKDTVFQEGLASESLVSKATLENKDDDVKEA